MKSLSLKYFCGIAAVFMMNCATIGTEVITRNSNGYDYNIQTEENRLKIDKPEWVSSDGWKNWKEENERNGTYLYFMGSSIPEWNYLIKEGKNYWTEEDAANQALRDAMRQITDFISVEIRNDYQERISELSKQGGTEQNGVSVAKLKQYQAEEESLLEFRANSSATFEGLRSELQFTETLERTIIENKVQRKITATRCWIIFSVSKEDIGNARKRIEDDRQKLLDEKTRRESQENMDEEAFISLSREYENVITDLDAPDISANETLFGEKYNYLVFISTRLRTLATLETRNDAAGERYRNLRQKIGRDIRTYNPNDRQSKLIQDLRIQIRDRDARLDELRNERINEIIVGKQGYSLQTQTIIISFPQKPYETEISEADIFAANDMVSNLDYISFTNINGINNFAKAENGLYAPVISVSWNDAARYCNWLSKIYGLTPCYDESRGRITAYNNRNNGYRLPEEHEITAMLNSESAIVNEAEFIEKGIWSSTGFPQEHRAYKLSGGTGAVVDRLGRQSFSGAISDAEIGFRVVRNAK